MKQGSAIFFTSVLLLSTNVQSHEHFESYTWTDEVTSNEIFSRFSHRGSIERADFASFSLQCLRPSNANEMDKGKVRLFFTDLKGFGVPFTDVTVRANIDNKYQYEFTGKMSDGSFFSGYADDIPSDFYTQLKTGENIFIHSYVRNNLQSKNTFSLSGSTEAVESVAERCNLFLGDSLAVLQEKEAIRERYNRKIAELKAQMQNEIDKVS